MEEIHIERYTTAAVSLQVLQFVGQHELVCVRSLTDKIAGHFARLGMPHTLKNVPRVGHFYPRAPKVKDRDRTISTLENSTLEFLQSSMGKG